MRNYDIIYDYDMNNPELEYKGFRFKYKDIIARLYDDYKEDLLYRGDNRTIYQECSFDDYMGEHVEYVLEDMLYNLDFDIAELKELSPMYFESVADTWYYGDDYPPGKDYPTDEMVIEHYKGVYFVVNDFVI